MAELLLEIFSEEIPAKIQTKMAESFKDSVLAHFEKNGLTHSGAKSYITPRRLSLVIEGVPEKQNDSSSEKRGPRVDAPQGAIDGFLKSTGLALSELEKRNTDKGEFYFAVVKSVARPVSEVLTEILKDAIASLVWPKSMKWGNYNIRWTRPVHSILCVFNGHVLPVSFGHITAGNKTRGHRFLGNAEFAVANFNEYQKKLKDHKVILCTQERKKIIENEAAAIAKEHGLSVKADAGLLEEVAGLVEWPVVLLGRIEEKFMHVPQEVLSTAMRSHQKYFSLTNNHGRLAPYFITISNMESADKGQKIISGNERVLRARLEDAKFFWDQDRRVSLESRVPDLEKVIFHAKLGTVAEKTQRMIDLAKFLAVWIPHANLVLVEKAANLSKVDLVTGMVGEFPELQGLMGSYYAIESKEEKEVAAAIKEHYSPVGPNDECPKAPLSIAVALADKIDTLAGLFSADEKPTGSKDPYALRRAALGVIRIILENNLRIPLRLVFERAVTAYPDSLFQPEEGEANIFTRGKKREEKRDNVVNDLLDFFADRLKASLKDKAVRHDLIQAVFDGGSEDDLSRLVQRVDALSDFVATQDGVNLLAAYKRATNIVTAEEKKEGAKYSGEPIESLLKEQEEKDLYGLFSELQSSIEEKLKEDDFASVMRDLAKLRKPIDKFFDGVEVNCDEFDLRKNRLLLLAQFRQSLNQVADFGVIEG